MINMYAIDSFCGRVNFDIQRSLCNLAQDFYNDRIILLRKSVLEIRKSLFGEITFKNFPKYVKELETRPYLC